eukprot:COSAG01_NODE_3_length_63519_cov_1591.007663_19_plen_196_part_00
MTQKARILSLVLACIVICTIIMIYEKQQAPLSDNWIAISLEENAHQEQKLTAIKITLHIAGEVKNPGVYKTDPNQRVLDVIKLAGGLTPQANLDKINLAAKVKDGKRIFIPATKSRPTKKNTQQYKPKEAQTIHINTASITELQNIPGVGQKKAQSIYLFRQRKGPFEHIEDLEKIKGIGPKQIQKWQKLKTIQL